LSLSSFFSASSDCIEHLPYLVRLGIAVLAALDVHAGIALPRRPVDLVRGAVLSGFAEVVGADLG